MAVNDLPEGDRTRATAWLQGLASRGVTISLRNGRISFHPGKSYSELTDDEVLTLRHCRTAIKAVLSDGTHVNVATPQPAAPAPTTTEPQPPQQQCPYCHQTPCVGPQHHAYDVLHWSDPVEIEKRREDATRVMYRQIRYGHPQY